MIMRFQLMLSVQLLIFSLEFCHSISIIEKEHYELRCVCIQNTDAPNVKVVMAILISK